MSTQVEVVIAPEGIKNKSELKENFTSLEIGEKKEDFPTWLVEEIFEEEDYQVIDNSLLARIDAYEKIGGIKRDLLQFLDRHRDKHAFIRVY